MYSFNSLQPIHHHFFYLLLLLFSFDLWIGVDARRCYYYTDRFGRTRQRCSGLAHGGIIGIVSEKVFDSSTSTHSHWSWSSHLPLIHIRWLVALVSQGFQIRLHSNQSTDFKSFWDLYSSHPAHDHVITSTDSKKSSKASLTHPPTSSIRSTTTTTTSTQWLLPTLSSTYSNPSRLRSWCSSKPISLSTSSWSSSSFILSRSWKVYISIISYSNPYSCCHSLMIILLSSTDDRSSHHFL